MRFGSKGFPAISFCLLLSFYVAAQQPSSDVKAYAMDTDAKAVQSISLSSGTVLQSAKFEKTPAMMVLSPDGSRLLVFERGDREHLAELRVEGAPILRIKGPNSLNIFSTQDMKLLARIGDAGWNAISHPILIWPQGEINAAWDSSGRYLTVLAWGQRNKKRAPEIVQFDVAEGKINGRLPLACEAGDVNPLLQVSGDTAAVLYGRRDLKNVPGATHKLVLFSLKNIADNKEITLPGIARSIARSLDGSYVFTLADEGVKNKDKGNAHLHTISALTRTRVQSTDGGFFLSGALADPASGLTLVTRMGKDRTSTLFAFDGDRKKAEIELPDVALDSKLAPKTSRLYVLCYNSVQVFDIKQLKLAGSISTPHRKRGMWESGASDRPPSSLAFDTDEKIGVLGYSGDDELSVLDLKELRVKGTIDLVSGAKSFGKMMFAAAAMGAVAGAGSAATGAPVPVFVPQGFSPLYSSAIVDPSGKLVYILGGMHLYVADLDTDKKVSGVGLGFTSNYLYLSPQQQGAQPMLFVVGTGGKGKYRMSVIDTTTRDKAFDQKWLGHCLFTPEGRYAVNFDQNSVYLLDGRTLSNLTTVGGFKDLGQILLAPATANAVSTVAQ